MRLVPGLDRGLRMLEHLAGQDAPVAVSALARSLEIPRSAAYELVNTLVEHNVVRQGADGRIGLGPQLFRLGNCYAAGVDLIPSGQRIAHEVMKECEETTQIAVLDGRDALYLVKADPPRMVRLVSSLGARIPAHCTAIGKVLLAALGPDEAEQLLGGVDLERMSERSITQLPVLLGALASVRDDGWAYEEGESNDEVSCVAVPVHDALGQVTAAMSVAVPSARMNEQRRASILATLQAGAARLSAELGYSGRG